MPTYLDGETKTDRTLGDVDTDVTAIKAVTDLLPDGGALTDLVTNVEELELHFHNVERWWGAVAVPGEINAIEANVTRPFVATSGNDAWGTAISIKGTADNPVQATDVQFDGRQLLVIDSDHATPYRMRIIYGIGTSADAITAGQWSEIMFITAPGPFSSGVPVDIRTLLAPIGIKFWVQIWNATNLSTVSFFWNAHGYP